MAGQDRTGQDRTGQDRTGQDRTGQDRTGQDRTGQDRTGQTDFVTLGKGQFKVMVKIEGEKHIYIIQLNVPNI